jgi:superfamily II DNA/RNA helicase
MTNRRTFEEVQGDYFLKRIGKEHYRCVGQKAALRAALSAPPGATLLVNLPTGAGKSLCAQLPAVMNDLGSGLIIVVVPTTALAIDQQRAIERFVLHDTAYYSGGWERAQKNKEIRERIRNGIQRIVFTSPESLTNSLRDAVYDAARADLIRMLVVDEAHIVEAWGDDFRPAFYLMAGLRRDLLRCMEDRPFVTLLLSATVTRSCLEMLNTLFGHPGPFRMTAALQLRPEPEYWFAWCESTSIKKRCVLEAVRHLPRPLILYTSRREDAKLWQTDLSHEGFKRIGLITGDTPSQKREAQINRWVEEEIDMMIATSAFGLGVDYAHVRTVLHACLPESIDRFYQEVGRGGRDGKASVSLVIYDQIDRDIAAGLSEKRTISVELGLKRWSTMFFKKEAISPEEYRIPAHVSPEYDIDMQERGSLSWNLNTLTLMCRAELVELTSEPPSPNDAEHEDDGTAFWCPVRILDPRHLDEALWRERVEPERAKMANNAYGMLKRMFDVVAGDACVSGLLADAYRVPTLDFSGTLSPTAGCGGCPYCRTHNIQPWAGVMPAPPWVWPYRENLSPELLAFMGRSRLLTLFYEPEAWSASRWDETIPRALPWFFHHGIRTVVVPADLRPFVEASAEEMTATVVFIEETPVITKLPREPFLFLHPPGNPVPLHILRAYGQAAPRRVLIAPANAPDPTRSDRRLRDILTSAMSLKEFLMRLGR